MDISDCRAKLGIFWSLFHQSKGPICGSWRLELSPIEIKLFGSIEIVRDGEPLTDFRSQKALVILAYLISAGRPITREYLAGLAWPDTSQQQALGLLRRTLHDLASKLPGCLVVDRRTVCFSVGSTVSVDTCRFAELAARDDPAAWEQATDLYRSAFLEGIYLDDASELESWLLSEQQEWRQRTILLLESLACHYELKGAYARSLSYARRLVNLEPWREEAHCQVMLMLARTGQLSAALAQYHTCRHALYEELAVEPAQNTKAIYDRLRRLAHQSLHNLPHPLTPLIGRKDDLSHLTQLLADPSYRLITLIGVGGIGKSRLALALAHAASHSTQRMFLHGACFIPLAGVDVASQMVSAVIQGLRFPLQGRDPPDQQLFHYLQDKELLLVLDNVEQLISEESLQFLLRLLDSAPTLKLLITSRVRLGLHCEQLYWLQGLQLPTDAGATLDPASLDKYSAIELWTETVRRQQPDYTVSVAEAPLLVSIARYVQGLPLALELAAGWRSSHSSEWVATAISASLDVLTSSAPDIPPRQRSMRAVFQTSWCLLSTAEQAVFRRLAVFRGGFTMELAQRVTSANAAMLTSLLNKSLITPAGDGRYTLHELVRQFAGEQLMAAGEMETTQSRHAATLLSFLKQIAPSQRHFGARPGLITITDEYENVQAALRWCFDQRRENLGLTLVATLRDYWLLTNNWHEGRRWQELALALPPAKETLLARATVLNEYGALLGLIGEIHQARAAHEESMRLFAILGNDGEHAWALHHLACPEYQDGDDASCNEMLSLALATFRRLGDELGIAHTLQRLTVQMLDGDEDLIQAEQFATESLAVFQRLDARSGMAGTLILLAEIMLRRDEPARAATYLTQSLASSAPNSGLRSWALGKLGKVLLKQRKFAEAKATFYEALCIRRDLGSVIGVAWMLEALGEVAVLTGDMEKGVEMYSVAASLRARHGQPLLAVDKRTFEQMQYKARAALGEERFAAAWRQGELLAHDETNFVVLFGLEGG